MKGEGRAVERLDQHPQCKDIHCLDATRSFRMWIIHCGEEGMREKQDQGLVSRKARESEKNERGITHP